MMFFLPILTQLKEAIACILKGKIDFAIRIHLYFNHSSYAVLYKGFCTL